MKMKCIVFFALATLACASGDAPPIPYSSTSPESYNNDRIQTTDDHYVNHFGSNGFNIQTGYEEYLMPGHSLFPYSDGHDVKGHHGVALKFLKHLYSLGWKVLPKIASGAVVLLALFLIGGCVNALVCTFTPLCTFSFAGYGITKDYMRSYLSPDRISHTADFVVDAIKKYKNMYESLSNEVDSVKK